MKETRSWRRGFAAGFAALALSVGGQLATSGGEAPVSCSVARTRLADRLADRFGAHVESRSIAQRVARALLGVVLQTCS